jgi:predicted ribosomally synthesized peptide with nif11-like leader
MSKESAKKYLEKLEKDKAFDDKVSSAKDDETRWQIVKQAGFDFTKEELKDVIREQTGGKLSEAELDKITGGAPGVRKAVTRGIKRAVQIIVKSEDPDDR